MVKQLFGLIVQYKKWWLLPILMVLTMLSLFLALSGGISILPAIYALF